MSLRDSLQIPLLVLVLGGSSAAFAQGSPQTHHCKLADGTMDMKKTHKQCTAAKGTWAQDAAKDAGKAAPKDAPKAGAAPAPAPPAAAPKK